MITHTISVTELLWTLFCSIGLIYNARIFGRAIEDLFEVRVRKINSLREYSARLTVFTYGILTFAQFAFVMIGIVAMFIPPPPGNPTVNPLQVLLTVMFIAVSAVMATGAYINEHGRRKLVDKIAELERM